MSKNLEIEKPLVLLTRSEILVAKAALEQVFDHGYHRIRELRNAVDEEPGWKEEFAMVYRGAARATVLYALHEAVVAPDPSDNLEVELWRQAGAARILGEHFASLMASTFTAKVIAVGLINHDPEIEGPISASIPVFMAA